MPDSNQCVGKTNAPHLRRFLPQVVLATFIVSILPVIVVWKLRATGAMTSMPLLILVGVVISLVLGWLGRVYWERRPGSGDILFGELMIWGFMARWRTERRLASAKKLLGLAGRAQSDGAEEGTEQLSQEEHVELLEQLAAALEARDPYTHGHSRRVARHAAMTARKMGLPPAEVSKIRTAAVVHDVGKIDTPTDILHKPDRLTDEEFEVIKQHPVRGAEMVIERDFDLELAEIVGHHHERIDGTGYPDGLSGSQIPLGARIVAVADTFDALTSQRPYRSARPHKKALAILNEESGTQLDPVAVRAFCSHYSGFRPLAVWALVTNLPQRVLYPVLGELQAGAASAAKVMAAGAAAVGATGAVAATAAVEEGSSAASDSGRVAVERVAEVVNPGDEGSSRKGTLVSSKPGSGNGSAGSENRNPGSASPSDPSGSGSAQDPGAGSGGGSGSGSGSSGSGGGGNSGSGGGNSGSGGGNSGSGGGGSSGSSGGNSGSGGGGSSGSGGGGNSGSGGGGSSGSGGGGSSGSGGGSSSGSGGGGSSGSGGGSSGSGGGSNSGQGG
jgi:putative nucleotidyltransferase with HDIG domain